MTNPPWFGPEETPRPNRALRGEERCEASASEVYTAGGEVGFIARLAADSSVLRERVRWYTSLVGKRASLPRAVRAAREAGAVHVRTTELTQGSQSRWAVAWSFDRDAAPADVPPPRPAVKLFNAPAGLGAAEVTARVLEGLESPVDGRTMRVELDEDADAEATATAMEAAKLVARGRVVFDEPLPGEAQREGTGSKRSRVQSEGEAGATPPAATEFIFEAHLITTVDEPVRVRVSLVGTTRGEASSAFWRLAESLRNDVVRDTRKWRRRRDKLAEPEARPDHN